MCTLTINTSLMAVVCAACSSIALGQHTQNIHESLVDDFYTPYPITLTGEQSFSGTIGELKNSLKPWDEGDFWDIYVFQSPGSGQLDIDLEGFDRPVNLSLERSSSGDRHRKQTVAESINRFVDAHRISTGITPQTTYYIAVGTGAPDNGLTPYELTVRFSGKELVPVSTMATGEYAVSFKGSPCIVPSPGSFDLELPVYIVSSDGSALSTEVKPPMTKAERIHEMLSFDSIHGTLVHEYTELLLDEESGLSLQRDMVVLGNFEGGKFSGEIREHDIVKSASGSVTHEKGDCSRQVTAISR